MKLIDKNEIKIEKLQATILVLYEYRDVQVAPYLQCSFPILFITTFTSIVQLKSVGSFYVPDVLFFLVVVVTKQVRFKPSSVPSSDQYLKYISGVRRHFEHVCDFTCYSRRQLIFNIFELSQHLQLHSSKLIFSKLQRLGIAFFWITNKTVVNGGQNAI